MPGCERLRIGPLRTAEAIELAVRAIGGAPMARLAALIEDKAGLQHIEGAKDVGLPRLHPGTAQASAGVSAPQRGRSPAADGSSKIR